MKLCRLAYRAAQPHKLLLICRVLAQLALPETLALQAQQALMDWLAQLGQQALVAQLAYKAQQVQLVILARLGQLALLGLPGLRVQ